VKLLLAHGADVNAKDNDGRTPLHRQAARKQAHDMRVAELLLAHGTDANAKDNDGKTPLHLAAAVAAAEGDTGGDRMVRLLLANKADVNARDNNGGTPLHSSATKYGHTDVAELLLAHGADVNAKDNDGCTPIHYATHAGRRVADLLYKHGGRDTGVSIHDVARDGDLEKIKSLLGGNPDLVFSKDKDGMTPLHHAARWGHTDVAKFLLDNKSDVNAKCKSNSTPLYLAAFKGRTAVAELLLAHGADVNAMYADGNTPTDVVPFTMPDRVGGIEGERDNNIRRDALVTLLRQHGGRRRFELKRGTKGIDFP
jgi:ankyrin repeat protein